ncbi:MAG: hypothetical protein AMXMBFR84_11760 [Candidatus Hydrogenedentota bacterium]
MKLSHILRPDWVVTGLAARTLPDAIQETLTKASRFSPAMDIAAIVRAVQLREQQGSTAVGRGIAIPHARIAGLTEYYVLLGVPQEALAEVGQDGTAIDLVFILLGNSHHSEFMLQSLALIAEISKDNTMMAAIRGAPSGREIWAAIDQFPLHLKQGVFAADVMERCAVVVQEDTVMGTMLDQMAKERVDEAAVCTTTGRLIGEVTSREIIAAIFPDCMLRMPGGIGFMSGFEPFNQFFQRERHMKVKDVMNRAPLVVSADDALSQVVFRMHSEGVALAWVLSDLQLTGLVRRNSIMMRVLRT